jgi:hypothetical protein
VWPLCPPKATLRLPELREERIDGSSGCKLGRYLFQKLGYS